MTESFTPITTESLKEIFVSRFEALILSGKISVGETLPSERELATLLKVSRPVVHEGLLDLSNRGLVTIKPRSGTVVNDFRKQGSIPLLLSLLNYHGTLDPKIQQDILEMRLLFENEMARLCARNRETKHLLEMNRIIEEEKRSDKNNYEEIAKLDYSFHQLIALASGNFIYSLLINSFKEIYLHLSSLFFSDPEVCDIVFQRHEALYDAFRVQDVEEAESIMTDLLNHGAEHLKLVIERQESKTEI